MKILLSAGHGAGKEHNRGGLLFNEGDNNFNYSLILKKHLESYEGVTVDLVRTKITDNPSLAERSAMGKGYDLFLDLHSNGASDPKVSGSEVWDSVERPNKDLAVKLVEATAKAFNHNNRGVKYKEGQKGYNWYGVLRFNQAISSMIIENGFHTNIEDSKYLLNNLEALGVLQASVIASHYGLSKKSTAGVHWAEGSWISLNNKGIKIHEKRFNDPITRGEMFAILDKIIK